MKKLKLILILVIGFSPLVFSQQVVDTSRWYHDYEIDYFPRIMFCRNEASWNNMIFLGCNFQESLERVLSACLGSQVSLKHFPGSIMNGAGLEPKEMRDNTSIYINVLATGSIHSITIGDLKERKE